MRMRGVRSDLLHVPILVLIAGGEHTEPCPAVGRIGQNSFGGIGRRSMPRVGQVIPVEVINVRIVLDTNVHQIQQRHVLVTVDVLTPPVPHGIAAVQQIHGAAGMADHGMNARRIASRRAGDPRTGTKLRRTRNKGISTVRAIIGNQVTIAVLVHRAVFVAGLNGRDVVIQRDIHVRIMRRAHIDRLTNHKISAARADNNLIRCRHRHDNVVGIEPHGHSAVDEGLHVLRGVLDGHEQPFVVHDRRRFDDGVGLGIGVVVLPGIGHVISIAATEVVIAGQGHGVAINHRHGVGGNIGMLADIALRVHANRVDREAGVAILRYGDHAVILVIIERLHVDGDIVALGAVLGVVAVAEVGVDGEHGLRAVRILRPGADALPAVEGLDVVKRAGALYRVSAGHGIGEVRSVPDARQFSSRTADAGNAIAAYADGQHFLDVGDGCAFGNPAAVYQRHDALRVRDVLQRRGNLLARLVKDNGRRNHAFSLLFFIVLRLF